MCTGPTFVKTSVLKDGHTFVVHLVDPKELSEDDKDNEETTGQQDGGAADDMDSVTEKADQEKSEKEDKSAHQGMMVF